MLLSSIVKASNFEIDINQFRKEINDEVANYKKFLKKKGVSIPILLEEDADLAKVNVDKLRHFVQTGQLDMYEGSYIADALTLSEAFNCLSEKDAYVIESLVLD